MKLREIPGLKLHAMVCDVKLCGCKGRIYQFRDRRIINPLYAGDMIDFSGPSKGNLDINTSITFENTNTCIIRDDSISRGSDTEKIDALFNEIKRISGLFPAEMGEMRPITFMIRRGLPKKIDVFYASPWIYLEAELGEVLSALRYGTGRLVINGSYRRQTERQELKTVKFCFRDCFKAKDGDHQLFITGKLSVYDDYSFLAVELINDFTTGLQISMESIEGCKIVVKLKEKILLALANAKNQLHRKWK